MLDFTPVLLVGSPRSGTTWLQLLMSEHPSVATAPETQIFAYYLDHFRKQWEEEHQGKTAVLQGRSGLSRLLDDEEFRGLCRSVALAVFEKIRAQNPGAAYVVEKSPRHAVLMEWIVELIPEAWVIHVIRDPRDTVASIIKAGGSWGASWAPRNPIDAARLWRSHVEGARYADLGSTRYLEVQYERLRTEPVAEIKRLMSWIGSPVDDAWATRVVDECDLSVLRGSGAEGRPVPGTRSPEGFFGSGSIGGWREVLGSGAVRVIEAECGGLMDQYGYERIFSGTRPPYRIWLHDGINRVKESLDWQLTRLLARI